MLEVCFGDSVKGALRVAQHCGKSIGGAVGVIMQGKQHWWQWWERRKAVKQARKQVEQRQRALNRQAVALGGSREDVLSVSFNLSYGDIASPIEAGDCPRKRLVWEWFTAAPWGEPDELEADAVAFWQNCLLDDEKLQARARAGEPVRIWADHTPAAACGLLYVAGLLEGIDCEITVVPLPQQCTSEDGSIRTYRGWGDVEPELFGTFLDGAVVLSKETRAALAERWRTLQAENAMLRVVKGESVVSAGLDHYDDLIRQECPKDTFKVAQLIGKVLSRSEVRVGDWLIAQRIRALLKQGELVIVREDPKRFYNTEITCAI